MEVQNKETTAIQINVECQHDWKIFDYSDVDYGVYDAICSKCLSGARIVENEWDMEYYGTEYIPGLLLVKDAGDADDELIERYLNHDNLDKNIKV